jgi:quercetin dioxygenase-like cupin family protein
VRDAGEEDALNLPATIDNGAGERLTFERLERGDDGVERLIVRNEVQPGKGPPMHVHFRQAEELTVVEGRLGYQILGEAPRHAGPGHSARFDAGVPHRFWADGDETLLCTGWISPPHNIVWFLSEIYRSTRENGGAKPNDLDAAWLMHRYRSEFDMHDVPAFVKRGVFPLLRIVGAASGRYRKYRDAPPPIA